MKQRTLKLIRILTLAWMIMIFLFSAQEGDDSTQTSHRVGLFLGRILVSDFDRMSETEQLEWAEKIDLPVRKAGHATEYAVLAVLFFFALTGESDEIAERLRKSGAKPMRDSRYLWSFLLTAVYAGTDEFHQLFVKGRAGSIIDVGIDSLGALAGLLILWGIRSLSKLR